MINPKSIHRNQVVYVTIADLKPGMVVSEGVVVEVHTFGRAPADGHFVLRGDAPVGFYVTPAGEFQVYDREHRIAVYCAIDADMVDDLTDAMVKARVTA